jgi:preprotein translocase subunit YajC
MLYNLITLQSTATGGDYSGIIMLIALIAIFYFLMIRPQQKKQKQIRQFRDALQKGDDVITAGGIYGKIKEVKDNVILLSVADGVTIKVDKGSVYPSATDAQNGAEAAK